MDHDDYEAAETTGNIRSVKVLGTEALGRFLVLELEAGPPEAEHGVPLGKWTLSLELARELVADLVSELAPLEDAGPEARH